MVKPKPLVRCALMIVLNIRFMSIRIWISCFFLLGFFLGGAGGAEPVLFEKTYFFYSTSMSLRCMCSWYSSYIFKRVKVVSQYLFCSATHVLKGSKPQWEAWSLVCAGFLAALNDSFNLVPSFYCVPFHQPFQQWNLTWCVLQPNNNLP